MGPQKLQADLMVLVVGIDVGVEGTSVDNQ